MARVLIVEDDGDISSLLARRLRTFGHVVTAAPSARMAIKMVGFDNPIDIALLDIMLPGMNGFELLAELRRHPELDNSRLPAVFLSATTSPENFARAQELGCAYLTKPFVSGELQGALLSALGESKPV